MVRNSRLASVILLVASALLLATTAGAQTPGSEPTNDRISFAVPSRSTIGSGGLWVEKPTTRRSIVTPGQGLFAIADETVSQSRPDSIGARRPAARKVLGGVLGAVGGFFAGGFIGAKVEPDCNCDDPGWKGFVIGAPVGAIAGAFAGVALASR